MTKRKTPLGEGEVAMSTKELGIILAGLRKTKGITQKELADQLGMHQPSLWTGIGAAVLFAATGLSMLASRARMKKLRKD